MKIITLVLCLACISGLRAQDYDKLAQLTCDCLATKDPTGMDFKTAQIEMGLCLIGVAQESGVDVDFSKPEAMRGLGEKVGVKMAGICLETLLKFTGKQALAAEAVEERQQVAGTIKTVETDGFVFVTLKESNGRETKFLWLRYFEGSDDFVESPKKLTGKYVTLTYSEVECFVPKAKGYFKQKEITSLTVN